MLNKGIEKVTICCLLFIQIQVSGRKSTAKDHTFQDQTSPRTNTLFDDADDIQRQLDNEARDRLKFGRPKTIWVFHFPTHFPENSPIVNQEQNRRVRRDTAQEKTEKATEICNLQPPKKVPKPESADDICKATPPLVPKNEPKPDKADEICNVTPPIIPKKEPKPDKADEICKATPPLAPKKEPKPEKAEEICVTPPLPSPSGVKDWDYEGQQGWALIYADCAGRSQSPVDLPTSGLVKARGARAMLFKNYDLAPSSMSLINDRRRIMLVGDWEKEQRPLVYGGAAHSRRYLFQFLSFHWPSEHTVGGLKYPLESQAFFVSAEYKNMDEALDASSADPQAFLGIVTLYKYGNHTHKGLDEILDVVNAMGLRNGTLMPKPLSFFDPPFKEYACYQGSMSWPPCTESVLWLIRGRTLSVKRETIENRELLMTSDNKAQPYLFRMIQPMNDRKVYLFK